MKKTEQELREYAREQAQTIVIRSYDEKGNSKDEKGGKQKMIKFKNVNSGVIISEREYLKLLEREAKDLWKDERNKDDFKSYEEFKRYLDGQPDDDFVEVDEEGEEILY